MNTPSKHEIDQLYANLKNVNYYEILGINKNANKLEISQAFRDKVSVWHIDRFAQSGYDDATIQKVRAIFQHINDANRTLSNPVEKGHYDAKLEGKPDVSTVLATENKFLRAKRALRDDKTELAKQLFDEVCLAAPDDPNYRFHKLYVDYLMLPKTKEGLLVDKAPGQKIYNEMNALIKDYKETADWMYEFIGITAIGIGDEKAAQNYLRRALRLNSSNINAQRRLRIMERRSQNSSAGFLDTIKGWFSK